MVLVVFVSLILTSVEYGQFNSGQRRHKIQWIKEFRALLRELRVKFREISLKRISQTKEAYGICGGLMVCKQKNKG